MLTLQPKKWLNQRQAEREFSSLLLFTQHHDTVANTDACAHLHTYSRRQILEVHTPAPTCAHYTCMHAKVCIYKHTCAYTHTSCSLPGTHQLDGGVPRKQVVQVNSVQFSETTSVLSSQTLPLLAGSLPRGPTWCISWKQRLQSLSNNDSNVIPHCKQNFCWAILFYWLTTSFRYVSSFNLDMQLWKSRRIVTWKKDSPCLERVTAHNMTAGMKI